jgi:hypothetical protein
LAERTSVDREKAVTDDGSFYRPGKSIQEFHADPSFIRVLIGGRGSGKTAATVMEATRHCWANAGGKCLFVRKTELSQVDSTIDSMLTLFSELDPNYYTEGDDTLFKTWNDGRTVRLPSRLAIAHYEHAKRTLKTKAERKAWLDTEGNKWCGFIEFRGLPNVGVSQSKLRGFECSFMALVEADQMGHQDFMLSLACLRWKGADPETCDDNGFILDTCVILDTNPPDPDHWIAKLEDEEKKKSDDEKEMRFWHISTYENEHNLPPDYIRRQILLPYANNPAMIKRMLYGQYEYAFSGNPVFYNFRVGYHVGHGMQWPTGATLIRGWDFGTFNCVLWSAYFRRMRTDAPKGSPPKFVEYLHFLAEQYMEESDTDRQAKLCIERTKDEFEICFDTRYCAAMMDVCDPSGENSNFSTEKTKSSVAIMNTHGIYPATALWNRSVAVGLTIMNRLFMERDEDGDHILKVDKESCPLLYNAFAGGYRYPADGEGQKKDEPLKGLVYQNFDYSHLADPARYIAMNCFRLARSEFAEKDGKPNFVKRKNPNPTLTYY